MFDGSDFVRSQQLWEQALHRLTVLKHVRDPRRRTGIVFEHEKLVRAGTDEINPTNMRPHSMWRRDARHGQAKLRVGENELFGNDTGLQTLAFPLNVTQEDVTYQDSLL